MRFEKVESVGNHFVLIEAAEVDPALVIAMCRPHFGVGADGLLAFSDVTTEGFVLRMFNPDGTEDFCGNGLRAASWALRSRLGPEFVVRHLGRDIRASIDGQEVTTWLSAASYDPADVPHLASDPLVDRPLAELGEEGLVGTFSVLSTGSAHLVARVAALPEAGFDAMSEAIEHHPLFPERVSVMWTVADGPDAIRLRIWERGAGETWGCGSGATAAALDELRRRNRGGEILVTMRGGSLRVQADDPRDVARVVGAARVLFRGEWA